MNAHPLQKTHQGPVQSVTAGSDKSTTVLIAPFDATIESAAYIPDDVITGANTNSRTISIVNKGQNGAGANVVASLALTNGVNAPAFDEKPIPVSGTAANLQVSQGDVLAFVSVHVGTGLADSGGLVKIVFQQTLI